MGKITRPEHTGAPEIFYSIDEARKYTRNNHMINTQRALAERCLELLSLPFEHAHLLDIGCGSGISGQVLTEAGHSWSGIDISPAMLQVAKERNVIGDLIQADMGEGVPFNAASFDGAISVSAIQWLCNAEIREHNPVKRLFTFFSSLYAALKRGTKAVLQFYPENEKQVELITRQATRAGFTGGVLVDFPNSTKAKKLYLVLFTGGQVQQMPKALGVQDDVQTSIRNEDRTSSFNHKRRDKSKKPMKKSKEWIQAKKDSGRKRGLDVAPDSKYTGRKRRRF